MAGVQVANLTDEKRRHPVFPTTAWINIGYRKSFLSHCKNKEDFDDRAYNAFTVGAAERGTKRVRFQQ